MVYTARDSKNLLIFLTSLHDDGFLQHVHTSISHLALWRYPGLESSSSQLV